MKIKKIKKEDLDNWFGEVKGGRVYDTKKIVEKKIKKEGKK